MASTSKSLRSSTANKRPTTAIADGQIALNTNATSPGLYFKDSTGASIIKIGPVHVGTTAPNVTPGAGGSAGNSTGEAWLDTSLTPNGWKVWTGAAWLNATPAGSATVQGLLELATDAETQTGSDNSRAVTPAGLQSKVSNSTSTTSSITIASSTAVKAAYDLADAALPKAGGTVTGNLEIGSTGSLTFEGATADAFETTLAVVDPTADRTITLPNATGTVVLDNNAQTVQFGLGAVGIPSITFSGDTNTGIYSPGADTLAFVEGGVEAMRIDSSGRLLVGTSTARSTSTVNWVSQIESTGLTGLGITTNDNSTGGAYLSLAKSRGTSVGSNTIVQNNDGLGYILFSGADGTDANTQAAYIGCEVDGTPGANDMPGRLVFATTVDGANAPTESFRVTSSGKLRFAGGGTNYNSSQIEVTADGIFAGATFYQPSAGSYTAVFFRNLNGNVGSITTTGSATAYTTSSDYRLKENVAAVTDGITRLQQLKPSRFNFIADPDKTVDGFIAHEAQAVVPECVTGEKDAVDDDGNPVYQGIDQSKLVPLLTAALQEAIAKIETLEARLTAAGIE
jgi:hypothetical protein